MASAQELWTAYSNLSDDEQEEFKKKMSRTLPTPPTTSKGLVVIWVIGLLALTGLIVYLFWLTERPGETNDDNYLAAAQILLGALVGLFAPSPVSSVKVKNAE